MQRWILFISLVFSSQLMAQEVTVRLDRSWGLLIGDLVMASITLPVKVSNIDEDSLPQLNKRHGPWLMLREISRHENVLELQYQVINVPAEPRHLNTPSYTLRTKQGGLITIPAARFSAGSFLSRTDENAVETIRGDQRLVAADFGALKQQLAYAILVFLLSATVWLIWHIGLRPGKRLPFAKAVFLMNKLRWFGHKDIDAANRIVHHAFNETAGTVMIYSQLQQLWEIAPWLTDLQTEITHFYQQSGSHYFSRHPEEAADFESLLKLVRACRAREKMA